MTKKSEDFSEWYNEVIEKAELSDKRYPIKGMNVWMPYGWALMKNIDTLIRSYCDATGHQEVNFPLLIPETEFQKEAQHIKGFGDQVYWVTKGGANVLDIPLLLRPTSETAMYPMFALWVRSHADLPLKTYQIVNTFRYETKQTRPFIRVREIHFFEAHTCHMDEADAEKQVKEDLEIMAKLGKDLCLPYILHKRPEWDKFAGAHYSIGVDAFMESGRALQVATVHHYRDNFSKAYGITYEDDKGEHKNVHQTTYGISERLLGGVVGAHGDDAGLVLPPGIVPIQVVVVPILAKGRQEEVVKVCNEVALKFKTAGIRTHLDSRDLRPGNKFFHWELRGVPLRVEIGMKDLEKGIVTVARRDTGKRVEVPSDEVVIGIKKLLEEVSVNLVTKAWKVLDSAVVVCNDIADARKVKDKILRLGWCGEMSCAQEIEKQTETSILGFPLDCTDKLTQCAICGGRVKEIVDSAKTY
jgi:prolyl-tRNA synthetase